MLHEQTKGEIKKCTAATEQIDKKLDEHIKWAEKNLDKGNIFIREHDKIIQKITTTLDHLISEMPAKGFCGKIDKTLYEGKTDKVEILWNDRRWIKNILYLLVIVASSNMAFTILKTFVLGK